MYLIFRWLDTDFCLESEGFKPKAGKNKILWITTEDYLWAFIEGRKPFKVLI